MVFQRLEQKLQDFIEGRLAQFLDASIKPRTITKKLMNAIEDNMEEDVAPDLFLVVINQEVFDRMALEQRNQVSRQLSQQVHQLLTDNELQFNRPPQVKFIGDGTMPTHDIRIKTEHRRADVISTQPMESVDTTSNDFIARHAYIVVQGKEIELNQATFAIGRHPDNDLTLNNPTVSRFHCQVQLRFGKYVLYDLQSKSGTYVNDFHVQAHQLSSGDTIRIGNAQLVYLEYNQDEDSTMSGDTAAGMDITAPYQGDDDS